MKLFSKHVHTSKKGFIALFSAILIASMLVFLVTTSSTATFFARFDALDAESQSSAELLAKGCANAALSILSQNYFYTPNSNGKIVAIASNSCTIVSIATTSAISTSKIVTIETQAHVRTNWSSTVTTAEIQNPSVVQAFPLQPAITILSQTEVPP